MRRIAFALVVAVAAAARLFLLDTGLPHYPQIDEPTLVGLAVRIGAGDPNPHFFKYGTAWPYALTLAFGGLYGFGRALGRWSSLAQFERVYFTDPTAFFVVGRALSAGLGVATVGLVYGLGRRLASPDVGLLAAALLAVAPLHITYCRYLVTDVPMTFAFTLALWLMVRSAKRPGTATLAGAALAAGAAVSIKYPAAVLAAALAFLAGTPFALLEGAAFRRDVASELAHARHGHYPLVPDQDGLAVYLFEVLPRGLGPPAAVLAAAGVLLLIVRAVRGSRAEAVLPVTLVVPYFAIIARSAIPFDRYALPLLPLLGVAAGLALARVAALGPAPVRRGVMAILVAAALGPPLITSAAAALDLTKPDSREVAVRWVTGHVPARTMVASELYGPALPASATDLSRRLARLDVDGHGDSERERQLARWRRKQGALTGVPEPATTYIVSTLVHGPGTSDGAELPYSLDALRAAGVGYVVLTSTMSERAARWPGSYPEQVRFHADLERDGRAVFTVDAMDPNCPETRRRLVAWRLGSGWCHRYHGPSLRIVRIDGGRDVR